MSKPDELEQHQQSLVEHLTELRVRLIRGLGAILIGGILSYSWSEKIFEIIRTPIAAYLPNNGLVFTAPMDLFMAHFKISLFAGAIISSPFWLYQVWKFLAPALYSNEKRYVLGFVLSGVTLFITGILVAYYLVLPVAFEFLLNFGGGVDKPMITISDYLSFFITMNLVFGAAFELPLILTILGMLGVVSQKFLKEKRRFAIVGLSFAAAILTPSPDVVSMLLLLAPLVLLYEVAVILVGFFEKKHTAPTT